MAIRKREIKMSIQNSMYNESTIFDYAYNTFSNLVKKVRLITIEYMTMLISPLIKSKSSDPTS